MLDFHFSKFSWWTLTLRKIQTLNSLTLEKHFTKLINLKKDKLYIKNSQKIFFYAFNTIMKLFFAIVYIRIITLTMIFDDHPLVEYPLWFNSLASESEHFGSPWFPVI